jgi:hypothetical protein
MTLFIPRLPAEARPPISFPPLHRWGFDVVWALFFLGMLPLGTVWLSPLLRQPFLALSGFFYVSAALGRRKWYHSRYCNTGELKKLLSFSVASYFFFGAGKADESLLASSANALGVFVALHLVFADGSAFLQAFGLRWSDVRRWKECNSAEVLLSLVIATAAVGLVGAALLALVIFASRQDLLLALAKTIAMIASIAVAAYRFRHTHDLHPHHYLGGILLLPLASAAATASAAALSGAASEPSIVLLLIAAASSFGEGLSFGLVIEGASTWGLDPILVRRRGGAAATGAGTSITEALSRKKKKDDDDGEDDVGEELNELSSIDYPTVVWCSVVASFSSPKASKAIAYLCANLLKAIEPSLSATLNPRKVLLADVLVISSMLQQMVNPWLLEESSPSASSASSSKVVVHNDGGSDGDALRQVFQRLEELLPFSPSSSSSNGNDDSDRAFAAFRAKVDGLAARIRRGMAVVVERKDRRKGSGEGVPWEAALYAVLNSVVGALNAGSVEISQSIALKRSLRKDGTKDEDDDDEQRTSEEVLLAFIRHCGGYDGTSCSGGREDVATMRKEFDQRHEAWRIARDACCPSSSNDGDAGGNEHLHLQTERLQSEIAALADAASQLR